MPSPTGYDSTRLVSLSVFDGAKQCRTRCAGVSDLVLDKWDGAWAQAEWGWNSALEWQAVAPLSSPHPLHPLLLRGLRSRRSKGPKTSDALLASVVNFLSHYLIFTAALDVFPPDLQTLRP